MAGPNDHGEASQMKRTYELALVLDPALSDEEQVTLVDEVKKQVSGNGVEVVKEESWGKRKLAYPIGKATEGRYVFLYVTAESDAPKVSEVELRLNQNERVLRYLWIRTDEDLRRAMRKGKRSVPAAEAVGITGPLRGGKGPREPREGAPERDRGFDRDGGGFDRDRGGFDRDRGYGRDRGEMGNA